MAMNRIQFQQGMSLPEFLAAFGNEGQCERALMAVCWPRGWSCPRCAHRTFYRLKRGSHGGFQCQGCKYQVSITAGTMMAATKLPLTTWFLAIFLISHAKNGISSLELKRQLGVSYPAAWLIHQKILAATAERDDTHRLDGDVLVDDAYLGGEIAGAKAGRGSPNKVPLVAAVSLSEDGRPRYAKLSQVSGFTVDAITAWTTANLRPGCHVHSDGLACFGAVAFAGATHSCTVVGGRLPSERPKFRWVNTVLGNLKTAFSGTHHAFNFAKYAHRSLAGYVYRLNRPFNLRSLTPGLIFDVARRAEVGKDHQPGCG
ncbi:MAG: IS1595 family transposase [Burkholderiaceae bacterium]